jgi:hypothetical protein
MDRVMVFNERRPDIGLIARTPTHGPELDLVMGFISAYVENFIDENRGKHMNLAVFLEPRIDSGYPDIVFAHYLPSIIDNWSAGRERLNNHDIKAYLRLRHPDINYGFPKKADDRSLKKLIDADFVTHDHDKGWQARRIQDMFGISELIAVEAKINGIGPAIDQAILNALFASRSFVLSGASRPSAKTKETCARLGLGLYARPFQKLVEAKRHDLLDSGYVPFKFNEWICKALALAMGKDCLKGDTDER